MSRRLPSLALIVVLGAGCSKHAAVPGADSAANTPAPGESAPPSPRNPGFLSDTSSPPVVVADTGNVDATLDQLTLELRRYVLRTRNVPRNFEEFAAKSALQAPPAPAGKKYAIKGQAVVLVKR